MSPSHVVPPALAKRGIIQSSDNLGPGDRVAVPARRIVDLFFEELREKLSQPQYLQTQPIKARAKPVPPQQRDLPGMESLALEAAYYRAGLNHHMPLERALSEPATRSCLEIMAREMGGAR